jgi:hypothetical protein
MTGGANIASSGPTVVAKTTKLLLEGASALTSGIVSADTAIKDKIRMDHQVSATLHQSKIDMTDAHMTELKGILSQKQSDIKELFDSFAKIIQSTRDMIANQGQAKTTAASV